jgi:hypothetical protein
VEIEIDVDAMELELIDEIVQAFELVAPDVDIGGLAHERKATPTTCMIQANY